MKFVIFIALLLTAASLSAAEIIPLTEFPFRAELHLDDGDLQAQVAGVDWVWLDRPDLEFRLGQGGQMTVCLAYQISTMSRLKNERTGIVRYLLKVNDDQHLLLSIEDLGFVTAIDPPGDTVKFTVRRVIFNAEVMMLNESVPVECDRELVSVD